MYEQGRELAFVLSAVNSQDFYNAQAAANSLYVGSKALKDSHTVKFLDAVLTNTQGLKQSLNEPKKYLEKFEQSFIHWINQHANNRVVGLESYIPAFSTGTTQAFDHFYLRHSAKKFKCFVGEYFYHLRSWKEQYDWQFITNIDDLTQGDALVLSQPFCDTGNQHNNYTDILDHCERLRIPVLLDCCYYGISSGINLNVNYNCIDTIAFSLSKVFPVGHLRIGMRYTNPNIYDGMILHRNINYNHSLSAWVGQEFINTFGSDYIYNNYRAKQLDVCEFLGITPSNTVLFGIGDSTWEQYSRRTLLSNYNLDFDSTLFANRICINSILEQWDLYQKFKNANRT